MNRPGWALICQPAARPEVSEWRQMDYLVLWREIRDDPLGLQYTGKTDAAVTGILNGPRDIARTSITGVELWECTALAELRGLDQAGRDVYAVIVGMDTIDVSAGTNSRAALAALFAAGSATRIALVALLAKPLQTTRAAQLGLGTVATGHVAKARAQGVTLGKI